MYKLWVTCTGQVTVLKNRYKAISGFLMEVFRAKQQFFCPPHSSIRIQGVFVKFLTI